MTMTADLVIELAEVFADRNWPTTGVSGATGPNASRFASYCMMLEKLEPEEQRLILDLTRDFLKCDFDMYPVLIAEAFGALSSGDLGNGADVIFVPITNPADVGDTKSGTCLTYLAKQHAPTSPLFSGKRLRFYDNIDLVEAQNSNRSEATIVFVDDYLGTGETAESVLDHFDRTLRKADDTVLVLVLVALKSGFDRIGSRPIQVIASRVRPKGISESARIADRDGAIKKMLGIESRLKVNRQFSLGFGQSEGLESMIRTPNNTFPVFWSTKARDNSEWPAPFPR